MPVTTTSVLTHLSTVLRLAMLSVNLNPSSRSSASTRTPSLDSSDPGQAFAILAVPISRGGVT